MKIVAIIGSKNSGKTTTSAFLIQKLTKDGYKVGAIKHIHHEFSMDTKEKDTWRMARSGSTMVSSISPSEVATMRRPTSFEKDLSAVLRDYQSKNVEVVVVEGFHMILGKRRSILKIVTAKTKEDLTERLLHVSPPILGITGIIASHEPKLRNKVPIFNLEKDGQELYSLVKSRVER